MENKTYDWEKRLIRQIKESCLYHFFTIVTPESYSTNEIVQEFCRDEEYLEYDPTYSAVVLIPWDYPKGYANKPTIYALDIEELDDEEWALSEETYASATHRIEAKCLNASRFTDAFMELMSCFIDIDRAVKMIYKSMNKEPFPYPSYDIKEIIKYFKTLQDYAKDSSVDVGKDDKLIKFFHPSIYDTRVESGLKSATEAWNDPVLMKKCIRNRLMYKKDITPEVVRDGFNIAKIAPKPSILTTAQAIDLIQEYTTPGDTIFDPYPGFSGKLLACIILGDRYYITSPTVNKDTTYQERSFIPKWVISNIKKIDLSKIYTYPSRYKQHDMKNSVEIMEIFKPVDYDETVSGHKFDPDIVIENELNINIFSKRFIFITRGTVKYRDYVVKVTKKRSHLYSYTENLIIIDR